LFAFKNSCYSGVAVRSERRYIRAIPAAWQGYFQSACRKTMFLRPQQCASFQAMMCRGLAAAAA
jgi:hypothetical protein